MSATAGGGSCSGPASDGMGVWSSHLPVMLSLCMSVVQGDGATPLIMGGIEDSQSPPTAWGQHPRYYTTEHKCMTLQYRMLGTDKQCWQFFENYRHLKAMRNFPEL